MIFMGQLAVKRTVTDGSAMCCFVNNKGMNSSWTKRIDYITYDGYFKKTEINPNDFTFIIKLE